MYLRDTVRNVGNAVNDTLLITCFIFFAGSEKTFLWSQAIRSHWFQVDQICIYMLDLILIYNVHDVTIIANYNLTDRQIKINTCNQIDKIKKHIITFYILCQDT